MKNAVLSLWFLSLSVTIFGQSSIDSVEIQRFDSLLLLTKTFIDKNEPRKALEPGYLAESLVLKLYGTESLPYAQTCIQLGRIFYHTNQFDSSEIRYKKALLILDPPDSISIHAYIELYNHLGNLYSSTGRYSESANAFLENLERVKKVYGTSHQDYPGTVLNLAEVYRMSGQLEKAISANLEGKSSIEKILGKKNPEYASCINNLAIAYAIMGDFEKAEPLFLEASQLRKDLLGENSPQYAGALNNLGILYRKLGNFKKSEEVLLQAKDIREQVFGTNHLAHALSLTNLGALYNEWMKPEKAEENFFGALSIRERILGKEHPEYAISLHNLSIFYFDCGQIEKALPLIRESLRIKEKSLGTEHFEYALSLDQLGILLYASGKLDSAELCFKQAQKIAGDQFGKSHDLYVSSLNRLGKLYWEKGNFVQSQENYDEYSTINFERTLRALHHLSESEMEKYIQKMTQFQSEVLNFASKTPTSSTLTSGRSFSKIAYDNSLFFKGFLLNISIVLNQYALKNPQAAEKMELLKSYHRRLATEYTKPIAKRTQVYSLEASIQEIEKDLIQTIKGYERSMQQVNWKQVQDALQPGEAAVEFVRYHDFTMKKENGTHYAALILLPEIQEPIFQYLCKEEELEKRFVLQTGRRADFVNTLYAYSQRGAIELDDSVKNLSEFIFQPIQPYLKKVQTIYFSPVGLFHQINLSAIALNNEEVLGDHFQLVQLNSTRQLAISSEKNPSGHHAVLLGGIHYQMDSLAIVHSRLDQQENLWSTRGSFDAPEFDSTLRANSWDFLKWTENEINQLYEIISRKGIFAEIKSGYEPTEYYVKSLGKEDDSPGILHIATHGFFFPDPKKASSPFREKSTEGHVFKKASHPMMRSGLVLAGGNYSWKNGHPHPDALEDGILTAYEISQLNFSGTELMVLSACETGLGDIRGNEGVYGLQRAFKIAGVKYLIMSLWQIPDRQTKDFMVAFYRNWLEEELSIPNAFRATQLEMKERFYDPFQWAGFILLE